MLFILVFNIHNKCIVVNWSVGGFFGSTVYGSDVQFHFSSGWLVSKCWRLYFQVFIGIGIGIQTAPYWVLSINYWELLKYVLSLSHTLSVSETTKTITFKKDCNKVGYECTIKWWVCWSKNNVYWCWKKWGKYLYYWCFLV